MIRIPKKMAMKNLGQFLSNEDDFVSQGDIRQCLETIYYHKWGSREGECYCHLVDRC